MTVTSGTPGAGHPVTWRPTHAVVGATDLSRTSAFLEACGFVAGITTPVDAASARALYGLDAATEEVLVTAPGAARGFLRLVKTPHTAVGRGPFALGPHAVDLYTRDVDASLEVARRAGASCGPPVRYALGPLSIGELEAVGPDHLVVVFIEVDKRRPSTLDLDDRLHSEVHSAVWTCSDTDAVLPFWREAAGWPTLLDVPVREPAVSAFMQLPRPDVPLRLTVMADASGGAPRFEFIHFPDDPGAPLETWPLRGGLHALGVEAPDVRALVAALPGVAWGRPAADEAGRGAVTGLAPGGVRLLVREP